MGGSVLSRLLVESGATVCLLERGGIVKQERSNWDVYDVVVKKKYQAEETWYDKSSSTQAELPPGGPSPTKSWNPTTTRLKSCSVSGGGGGRTPPIRAESIIPIPPSSTNLLWLISQIG
jgi:choline dehydrogenase-like flavoprotein